MEKVYVKFNQLIRLENFEECLIILDWLLKTGGKHRKRYGWDVYGISQFILRYSANEHNGFATIPKYDFDTFFDAVFSRAVYAKPHNEVVAEWREEERIFAGKYRVLRINRNAPKKYLLKHNHLHSIMWKIYDFEGGMLKKEYAQPDREDRTNPKIINIKVGTSGGGYEVICDYSFDVYNYEAGWGFYFKQKEEQSLWEFFGETYEKIKKRII